MAVRGMPNMLVRLPLSVVGLLLCRRGRLRGQLILAAIFMYLAYNYLIGVMGNAFNGLFLVWTALFSTGAFGAALTVADIDAPALPERLATGFPRRSLAVYMLVLGFVLLFQYLEEVLTAYAAGGLRRRSNTTRRSSWRRSSWASWCRCTSSAACCSGGATPGAT